MLRKSNQSQYLLVEVIKPTYFHEILLSLLKNVNTDNDTESIIVNIKVCIVTIKPITLQNVEDLAILLLFIDVNILCLSEISQV